MPRRWGAHGALGSAVDDPITAELFSVERLEQHATELAGAQDVSLRPTRGVSLHRRLSDNAQVLQECYRSLVGTAVVSPVYTPAAEWLIDNYYIVDEHIRAVRRDLPPEYYRQLPKLIREPLRGYPRVYGIGWALIAHTDSRFELDTLERFVRAYQTVQPLRVGELWAIAITLRVILIENLRRLSAGIVHRWALRAEADVLANQLLDGASPDSAMTAANLRTYAAQPLPNAFAAALFQRLRDHDPATTPALSWLHDRLAAQATNADDVVHAEHQRQGAVNASIRNVITSLRLISSVDWPRFVEGVSLVDALLGSSSNFAALDFSTRDLYRHRIEDLARGSPHTELEVARCAIEQTAQGDARQPRSLDPGYYLIAEGRGTLERALRYRTPWTGRLAHWMRAAGLTGYLGVIAALTLAIMVLALAAIGFTSTTLTIAGTGAALCALLCAAVIASDAAIAAVNLLVMRFCQASILPALELADGIPPELRTVVAVPVLLTSAAEIDDQVRSLEVHFLASLDRDLRFALLSDWTDADAAQAPDDQALLDAAAAGIARLNTQHGQIGAENRFLLLHRRRTWNERQRCWMGWERKRGKLHEFNRLLAGAMDTSFIAAGAGSATVPLGVRYVIVLDADTRLPHGAARQLIGKMAHPLNRPQIDPAKQRVTQGYGILQPRVTPALPVGSAGSIFQRINSGRGGIDPYAFAVSDVYQDLFGEGSYSGKGIYDLAAFEKAMFGRVRESQMLSHDLFEGTFARCGLASDIEVVEEYPPQYAVAASRQHRWTRGDWQLLPWILGARGGLPGLGRWKMIDNLRRSLVAPSAILLLLLVWGGSAALAWTVFVLTALGLPTCLPLTVGFAARWRGGPSRSQWRAFAADVLNAAALTALRIVFLADQAWQMVDAILRTLFRLIISRRGLLEWTTAAQAKICCSFALPGLYRNMLGSLALALATTALVALASRRIPALMIAFAVLWLAAPAVAWFLSRRTAAHPAQPLGPDEQTALRRMGRSTWNFFETFVTAEQQMLPPDNFQETPYPVIAHRTSPTNIGLYLLSVVAAREFGWIGTVEAADRLDASFASLERLDRYRGHFYNWYDTHDLRTLDPPYISTVDSGNLAGYLLALGASCREWSGQSTLGARWHTGIDDTLAETLACLRTIDDQRRNHGVSPGELRGALDALQASIIAGTGGTMQFADAGAQDWLVQADSIADLARALIDERGDAADAPLLRWAKILRANIATHIRDQGVDAVGGAARTELEARLAALAERARAMALAMDFTFLVEPTRELLSIGYRVAERRQDPSCYDLLASEARIASYIGIAKGDLPVRHWFRLGRLLTTVARGAALVSWSGSMFEYLMPALVMNEPAGSLLGETSRLIVRRQITYGLERRLPWGVSESAFNARDVELTYQYASFGVPGLGLKRGLGEEAVITPYATGLGAMVEPQAALQNFARLGELGARGVFGWYEALDFTPSRLPEGERVACVRSYMAHHQGMILIAIANLLSDNLFRTRFHADPLVQASEMLLQENTPRAADSTPPRADEAHVATQIADHGTQVARRFKSPHHAAPRTHLLSNGAYSLMVTAAGSGYSRCGEIALTRWREDPTCDAWGSWVYVRDVGSGQVWSAGYQPIGAEPEHYAAAFFEDHVEITRQDGQIVTTTEILVSPEDNVEVRRISISNLGNHVREIELTTYAEIVLATAAADAAHPAFSKLFVQTEFYAPAGALLATRRSAEQDAKPLWLAHLSVVDGEAIGVLQFETDRAKFLGRGREPRHALSILDARPLSDTAGTVLDPVFALRRRLRVAPGATAAVAFWTIAATSRAEAIVLVDKCRDNAAFTRVKTLSWTQAQVQLRYLGVGFDEAQQFQRIANRLLYADASLRAPRDLLVRNRLGQPALWAAGISGDLPIALIRVDDEQDLGFVKQLLRAHAYWQAKRFAVDLVILNERPPSYAFGLQHEIEAAIRTARTRVQNEDLPTRGRIFLLRADAISPPDREFLQTAARAILVARHGSLDDQLARLREPEQGRRVSVPPANRSAATAPRTDLPALEFFNGLGGFAADGREYVTVLDNQQWTPAPWTNVIANPEFGFLMSADGTGGTWSLNSRENRLTPWCNDPVGNAPSEVVYLCDQDSGELWSPTPLPIRERTQYVIRHGFGYSRCDHVSHGIAVELTQFVPLQDAVKIARLRITNRSAVRRRLSITHYLEWVLGKERGRAADFLITEIEPDSGALLARNPWNSGFNDRVAFMDMCGQQQSYTGDRAEFLGRHGSMAEPAALLRARPLSNRVGAGFDPCGAMQTQCNLPPGAGMEFVLLLGEAASSEQAVALIGKYRAARLDEVLAQIAAYWDETLQRVQVKTPDRSLDVLVNGWLLYQTLACRVWARTAFYQASGAYGFRDQLQDIMALCVARPAVAREHILRAAARQFAAGDVQHWWFPLSGQGVRTRVADDRVWLAYATAHYIAVTADGVVLDAAVPCLEGAPLTPEQTEVFAAPAASTQMLSLYEHCALALDTSAGIGAHGLPLFGAGDWNDGMNRVGIEGRGESVWLGWFLHAALLAFAPLAEARSDAPRAARWRKHAFAVVQAIEREAWDGDWYRRGYFDDGTPLGSVASEECRIDSIAQSWAVISGGGERSRALRAMSAVNAQLVRRSNGLVQLFTPPFDQMQHDPGYIKAYPPGIRENGGQYTHAALWATWAFALLGDGDTAGELFSLLNPINHSSTRAAIHRYKVEPYVACADVYSASAHVGRGGWTWYTGSAGWMYRTAVEGLCGLHIGAGLLRIDPCIPRSWRRLECTYRHGTARYHVLVLNPAGVNRGVRTMTLDGAVIATPGISLVDDGRVHEICATLG